MKKLMSLLGLVVVIAMAMSACQPVVQTVVVEKEVKVVETKEVKVVETQTVVETQIVEKTVENSVEVPTAFATAPFALADLKVRQAMAYCTNKVDIANAGYPLLTQEQAKTLVMDTFIPKTHWAYAGDENITIYPYDPEKGKALLEEAGWTMAEGKEYRTDANGIELAFKFTTTSAAFRKAWAAVWEKQMKDCGIHIIRLHAPASWWFGDTTGLARRDFEIGAFAWVGQADPGGQTLYACDQIPTAANNWAGQNDMGWCNEKASVAIKAANNTLLQEDRKKQYTIVQQEYTKDVPAIPLFNRTETSAAVADLTGFDPRPGEEYYIYNVTQWERPGQDTIVIGFTQEIASLHTLVESSFAANLALLISDPRSYTSLDYTYAPATVKQLSTLESGLAKNTVVEVKAGDSVADADSNIVTLEKGVKVMNSDGEVVEFDGTPVKMMQLVVTYEWRTDLKWPDGKELNQADFELGYKTACDKENGATSFILCDQTQAITFDGNNQTVTWKPGVQSPTYFLAPFGYYPAHRVIESEGPYKGKTLAEVPAKDWLTLPEIAETPWGVGGYKIVEWVKGEKIVYAVNEFAPADLQPKTPNLIITWVTPENAEAQLLTGAVDLLDPTTLAGLTEQLVNAEKEGKIKNYVIAGATWEHIDFNLSY
ncbi:MAG TPA: ABC transporter substrate-binding protein [Anaerolineaceae bacterium]|nr:ABC transporter substrate-binding protein [Anaerolineaceae bacterium]HPN51278.1 ABC transporter substrate-binding protein [Anaerolineaceae bacterium]